MVFYPLGPHQVEKTSHYPVLFLSRLRWGNKPSFFKVPKPTNIALHVGRFRMWANSHPHYSTSRWQAPERVSGRSCTFWSLFLFMFHDVFFVISLIMWCLYAWGTPKCLVPLSTWDGWDYPFFLFQKNARLVVDLMIIPSFHDIPWAIGQSQVVSTRLKETGQNFGLTTHDISD